MMRQAGRLTYQRRKVMNKVWLTATVLAAAATVLALVFILGYVIANGARALNLDFFSKLPKPVGETGGGMANAIVGTLIMLGLASAIALPIGVLTGVYLSEYGGGRFNAVIRFVADTMAGVPSIVVGMFAYLVVVLPMGHFSSLAGGIALAVIMIPIVTRGTEEILRVVPDSLREAALALGVNRWRVIVSVVIPTAAPGLITSFMLAIARASGETAPLLFTSLGSQFWSMSLDQPTASIPVQIFSYAIAPYDDWHRQAWAGALTLVAMVAVLTLVARLAFRGFKVQR